MAQREKTATAQLKVRLREPLRAQLESAAADNGISMNSEIVERLERSFREDREIEDRLGPLHIRYFPGLVRMAIEGVELKTGKKWNEDQETFLNTIAAMYGVIGAFGFSPNEVKNKELGIHIAEYIFKGLDIPQESIDFKLGRSKKKETKR